MDEEDIEEGIQSVDSLSRLLPLTDFPKFGLISQILVCM